MSGKHYFISSSDSDLLSTKVTDSSSEIQDYLMGGGGGGGGG